MSKFKLFLSLLLACVVGLPQSVTAQQVVANQGVQVLLLPGVTIAPFTAVALINGVIVPADPTDSSHNGKLVGVTVTGGAAGSGPVLVQCAGVLSTPQASFTPGSLYYLGLSGAVVTTTPPVGAVWQKFIGYAPDSTHLFMSDNPALYSAGNPGTVTSVGMTGDGTIFNTTVTGSPIASAGTLVPVLLTQSNNTWFGNISGGAAAPIFNTAALPVVLGGTGAATLSGYVKGNGTSPFTAQAAPIPIADGGTNNASLGISATGIYNGDGSKVVQTTGSALQSWQVNAAGNGVAAYNPYDPAFTSTDRSIATGQAFTIAHGLPYTPTTIWYALICQISNVGYAINDVVTCFPTSAGSASNTGVQMWADATNINAIVGSSAISSLLNKTTGTGALLTAADWKIRFYAR